MFFARDCGWVGRIASVRVWVMWLGCGLAVVGSVRAAWAQTATDGAIGGQVLSAMGVPMAGTLVVVREVDTGLAMRVLSDKGGEFLLVRLPVGEYVVTVEDAGTVLTLPGPVGVELGEVTDVEARMLQPGAVPSNALGAVSSTGITLTDVDMAVLPVESGALAVGISGASGAGADDDASEVSFRGVAAVQNSSRMDGSSGDESFGGGRMGGGSRRRWRLVRTR